MSYGIKTKAFCLSFQLFRGPDTPSGHEKGRNGISNTNNNNHYDVFYLKVPFQTPKDSVQQSI